MAIINDKTASGFLVFILFNLCLATIVIGFFMGTGQMKEGVAPCLKKIQADADNCGTPRFFQESPDIMACLEELQEYSLGNYEGHWSQMFLFPLIGAVVNVAVMGFFLYMHQAGIPVREVFGLKKKANPCTAAEDAAVSAETIGSSSDDASPPGSFGEQSPQHDSPQQCDSPQHHSAQA